MNAAPNETRKSTRVSLSFLCPCATYVLRRNQQLETYTYTKTE